MSHDCFCAALPRRSRWGPGRHSTAIFAKGGHGAGRARSPGRGLALTLCLVAAASLCSTNIKASADQTSGGARLPQLTGGLQTLGRPYAIVDKLRALISVHHADGRLAGRSAVILGSAPGDHSVPGVGDRTTAGRLRAQDKTTPAGRFRAQQGRNLAGETVIWLDYDAALAIHRLRPGRAAAQRAQALAQGDANRRRLSDGCVVVPGAFFDRIVLPLLGAGDGTVVVLPEGRATETVDHAP